MKQILFFSQKAYAYFSTRNVSDIQIIDYFDIEVQKIIHYIGYRLKKNPIIEKNYIPNSCTLFFDLDYFRWTTLSNVHPNTIRVIYECE